MVVGVRWAFMWSRTAWNHVNHRSARLLSFDVYIGAVAEDGERSDDVLYWSLVERVLSFVFRRLVGRVTKRWSDFFRVDSVVTRSL